MKLDRAFLAMNLALGAASAWAAAPLVLAATCRTSARWFGTSASTQARGHARRSLINLTHHFNLWALTCALVLAAPAVQATSCTWQTTSGNWVTVADWSCNAVPGGSDSAAIGGTGVVKIDSSSGGAQQIGVLNNAGAVNIDAFSLTITGNGGTSTNTGTITVGTSTTLSLQVGAITNAGTIQLNGGGGSDGILDIHTNALTLSGGGTVNLTTALGGGNASITGNGYTLTNVDNTIQGTGVVGSGGTLINGGTVNANSSAGIGTLTLPNPLTNSNGSTGGLLEATNGGTLVIQSTVNNANGNITVGDNTSSVQLNGATIQGGTLNNTAGGHLVSVGGVLDGNTSAVTLNGTLLTDHANTLIRGTITNHGTLQVNGGGGSDGSLFVNSNTLTLSGDGTVNLTTALGGGNASITGNGYTLTNVDNTIQGTGVVGSGGTLINGGTVNANSSAGIGTLTLPNPLTNSNGSTGGLLEATNGGTLVIQSTVNNANGNITVGDNTSSVQLNGATIQGGTLNNTAGGHLVSVGGVLDGNTSAVTLNGTLLTDHANTLIRGTITNHGTLQVNGGGGSDGSLFVNSNTLTLSGDGTVNLTTALGGGNASITGNGYTLTNVDNTIQGTGVVGSGGTLINGGTVNANSSAGIGTLTLAGGGLTNNGTFAASNGGILTATVPFTNTGLVNAISGTINANQGFTGTTGTARIDAAGTLTIGANSTVGTLTNNGTTPAALTLGTNNITVSTAYNNANFGTGNSFNNHANVSGTGQILAAGDVAQAITGAAVTNGTTTTPTLTLTIGNVHVGAATSFNYQIGNTGTSGPSLLGAIQTAVNGGNITDSRLSGSGVIAGNWGPLAPGSSTGNLAVTYTAATAGAQSALSGQAVHIANNFDNVAGQTMNIVLGAGAAAYNLAAGNATPSPATIANQRVGGTNSQTLTVANTAPAGSFTEVLNASFGANTGSATNNAGSITGGLGAGGVPGGSSNNTAMSVGVDTSASGARTGTVTLNYISNGTGTSGLGNTSVGAQTITVSGNVYQAAIGQLNSPTSLNFGTVQVGQNVSQGLSISNIATGAAGFIEDLGATFGASSGTGANRITGTGSIGSLLAGATNNSNMVVHVDTGSAGSVNGAIAINYTTNGTVNGVSNGLGSASAGSSSFGVIGTIAANVVDQANPVINNPTINLGNVRISATSPTAFVSVTNQATGNPQAALNASIAGNAPITASGSFNLLLPGSTNNSSLQVGMNTSAAGHIAGTATVAFVSDASNIGNCSPNCQLNLPSQNVNVSGNVYRLANPQQNTSALTLAGRVGGVGDTSHLTGAVSITNSSPDAFTEGLNVTRGTLTSTPAGGFTGSGSVTNLAAQGTSSALQVSLNTGTSGTFTGSQALNFVSTGAGTTGAPDLGVGTGSVTLNGHVYTPAVAQVNTAQPINLGIVHVGDAAPQANVSVTNAANGALNDSLLMSFTSASSGFTGSGNLGANGLAAGETNGTGLHVAMNTGTAGIFGGSVIFGASSHDSELADLDLNAVNVGVMGQVNNFAQSAFVFGSGAGSFSHTGSTYTLDFGTQFQGSGVLLSSLFAGNGALGPADLLNGTFQFLDALDFGETGFNPFFDLAAQQFTAGPLGLAFNTANLGNSSDTIVLHGIGHNASGYSAAVGDITLVIEGNVVRRSNTVPEPGTLGLAALALAMLAYRARRGSGRSSVTSH